MTALVFARLRGWGWGLGVGVGVGRGGEGGGGRGGGCVSTASPRSESYLLRMAIFASSASSISRPFMYCKSGTKENSAWISFWLN